jgi:hypothetical protein
VVRQPATISMVTEDRELIDKYHSINEFPEHLNMSFSGRGNSLWVSRECSGFLRNQRAAKSESVDVA